MIYVVTAMYAEAHPLITRFQLKKESSHTRFQVFRNRESDICLVISGVGSLPAAVAVSSLCTEYGAGSGDILLNLGVCGQIWNKNIPETENGNGTGKLFLCNKIREAVTGRTFYPDILYRHSLAEARIVTAAKPYVKPAQDNRTEETAGTDFYLLDMEAAAVYQAGAYFFGPHQMSFLKIVSDHGDTERVTSAQIEGLVAGNMNAISDYLEGLRRITLMERQTNTFEQEDMRRTLENLSRDLHCSEVMSQSLRQHIRYFTLAGVDYAFVLEEMYREGKLPCRDKREGKQRFEELRERLL